MGYGFSIIQTPTYQSNGLVLLNDPRTGGEVTSEFTLFFDPTRYIRNQVTVIQSPPVLERAVEIMSELGYPQDEIVVSISARVEPDLDAMAVTSEGPDANQTTAMVNATVQAYGEVISAQVRTAADREIANLEQAAAALEAEITAIDAQLQENPNDPVLQAQLSSATAELISIDGQIKNLQTQVALYGSGIQLFIGPQGPGSQIAPRPVRTAAIAFVLGALAAGAFAWWRAENDQRADNRDVPATVLDAPLLASVPDYSAVKAWAPAPTITHPESAASEAYHFALSSLSFVLEQNGGKAVVITSAGPAEGKTVTSLNLAIAAMKDGRRPLLIDGDERAKGLTRLATVDEPVSPNGAIGNGYNWAITPEESIDFIAGNRNLGQDIAGYFRSVQFRRGLHSAIENRELVIIDAPPVMSASETADLAAEVDGVVVVVERGTPLRTLADARDRIALTGTPILGYVFNKAEPSPDGYYTYPEKTAKTDA